VAADEEDDDALAGVDWAGSGAFEEEKDEEFGEGGPASSAW
jgi:hypothetical protein